jgi:NADP-dependent 3-hydroxy acid dehydrogenase YdfG
MKDLETNFIGPVNVTNAILPHMRLRREGTVVLIGSRSAYRQMVVSTFLFCALCFVHKFGVI